MKKDAKRIRKAGREIRQDASADRSLPEIRAILGASQGEAEFHPAENSRRASFRHCFSVKGAKDRRKNNFTLVDRQMWRTHSCDALVRAAWTLVSTPRGRCATSATAKL